jgi:hypothetical protein
MRVEVAVFIDGYLKAIETRDEETKRLSVPRMSGMTDSHGSRKVE